MNQKKPLGSKISEDKNLENQLVIWIQTEPNITDYEISKRLLDRFNVKISQPTIKKWRINFYKESSKEFDKKKEEIIATDTVEIDIKYDQLKNLLVLLDNLHERKNVIKKVLDEKSFIDENGNRKDRIDTFIESIYKDYINSIINLEDKILKYTAGANPFFIVREVIEKLTKFVLVLFMHYKVSDEDIQKYKEYIRELDGEYFAKYNIDRKIK